MDIDLDLSTTFNPEEYFKELTLASKIDRGNLVKHNCGAYFQSIPKDPVTGFSAIPFKVAEDYGYTKIDFLHLHIMDYFENKNQIRVLLKKEPKWGLLLKHNVVEKIFQLSNHGDILRIVQPKSILELADCIALIRPGKIFLLDEYKQNRDAARKKLYTIKKGSYAFKKGHAIAYAMNIVLQLHLIEAGIL